MAGPDISNRTIAGFIDSQGAPVSVVNGINDRTSMEGMTPEALAYLEAAKEAAAAAGLSQIVITAGRGGGHLSHASGTEFDIKGINPDGSLWTPDQRAQVAAGAQSAGADRFGLYDMENGRGKGTLHMGLSGDGRPAAVWGAGGRTSGAASREFTNPAERAFLTSYQTGRVGSYTPQVQQQQQTARQPSWMDNLPAFARDALGKVSNSATARALGYIPGALAMPFNQQLGNSLLGASRRGFGSLGLAGSGAGTGGGPGLLNSAPAWASELGQNIGMAGVTPHTSPGGQNYATGVTEPSMGLLGAFGGGQPVAGYQTGGGDTYSWTTGPAAMNSGYGGLDPSEYGLANATPYSAPNPGLLGDMSMGGLLGGLFR